jgi:hypothetical protein
MRRRLLATTAILGALGACSTAQQAQASATTAQVLAWLQASQTALETLITVSVPASAQAAAEAALAQFTAAAQAVGAAIASSAPISSVATGVQTVVAAFNALEPELAAMLPPNAQGVLAAVTISVNLLASFAQSVLGTPTPKVASRYAYGVKALTSVVP